MAFSDEDKDLYSKVVAKAERKKQAQKECIARKEERGVKLVCEKDPSGLYFVRHHGGGLLPVSLQMRFTSHAKAVQAVVAQYGSEDPLKE